MQPEDNGQPISIAARRASPHAELVTDQPPMTAERKLAYRRLAITILGMDLPTLTNELRVRRIERMAPLRVRYQPDRAA